MTRLLILTIIAAALLVAARSSRAQARVVSSDKLPPASIELKAGEPPATSSPWQLPKPGDPLYDPKQEAEAKDNEHTHTVRVFERGVFKGYATLSTGPRPQRAAKEMNNAFTPNAKLPPDAVQLSDSVQPDKRDYFPTRPKTRPPNVPADCIAVRVFHRGKIIGWTFMPKRSVELLHQPDET